MECGRREEEALETGFSHMMIGKEVEIEMGEFGDCVSSSTAIRYTISHGFEVRRLFLPSLSVVRQTD